MLIFPGRKSRVLSICSLKLRFRVVGELEGLRFQIKVALQKPIMGVEDVPGSEVDATPLRPWVSRGSV